MSRVPSISTLSMLWALSIRSLFSHKVKSLIVGSIMCFGTALVVIGTALLDSVEKTMAESITSSLAGHLQVYDASAKDDLALFGGGFMGAEDIGRIDDFSLLESALSKNDNVKAVIPMGIDMATVTSVGELDEALAELRAAVREGEESAIPDLSAKIRDLATEMYQEAENRAKITSDAEKLKANLALLDKVRADQFWVEFAEHPVESLEFLDTKLAPLAEEGRIIYFRYLGTDLDLFAQNFEKFEIVKGEMVPEKTRGFLFNEKFYDDWVKHYVARTLDKIHRGVTEEGRTIAGDPLLQALARQAKGQYRRISYQLDAAESETLKKKLRELFKTDSGELDELLVRFLTIDDSNIHERHEFFYAEIAPLIDLYAVDVGDIMTIRAFTRSGFLKSVNVKVYGTFRFKGLEKSDLAGGHSLMDILTFRELYGLMTDEKLAELQDIREEIGLKAVQGDEAEDALFGKGDDLVAAESEAKGFDEFAGIDFDSARETDANASKPFSQEEVDHGLALNAAVILKDSSRLSETLQQVKDQIKAAGLDLQVIDWQKASGIVGQFIIVIRSVLYLAISIIFLVALVIINNSMVMATMERVTEIGTMRAIGAQRSWVLTMFLVETLVLGLLAGGLGVLLGSAVVGALGAQGIPAWNDILVFLFGGPRLYPTVGARNLVFAFVVILLVSIVSTLYPAMIATKIQPVAAMQPKEA